MRPRHEVLAGIARKILKVPSLYSPGNCPDLTVEELGIALTDAYCAGGAAANSRRNARLPVPDNGNRDWTVSERTGLANSSHGYLVVVEAVRRLLAETRLGDNLENQARLIVSQLAHVHGLAPTKKETP